MKTQKRAMAPILGRASAGGSSRAIGVLTIDNDWLQAGDSLEPQPADRKVVQNAVEFAEDG